jgi:hypothetical protein
MAVIGANNVYFGDDDEAAVDEEFEPLDDESKDDDRTT